MMSEYGTYDESLGYAYIGDIVEEVKEMDPNQTLVEIRKAIQTIDRHGLVDDPEELETEFIELYKKVKALDNWLSNGGFLPEPWQWTTDDRKTV